jgi:hypothetical protein
VSSERLEPPDQSSRQPDGQKEHNDNRATAKRGLLASLKVIVERTNTRNPGNPFSYLTAKERARKLVQLWAEIARSLRKRSQHS